MELRGNNKVPEQIQSLPWHKASVFPHREPRYTVALGGAALHYYNLSLTHGGILPEIVTATTSLWHTVVCQSQRTFTSQKHG